MKSNVSLIKTQFGIFFKNAIPRPDLLTQNIASEFRDYFDSAPINLPIPAEIVDFPVAQLRSSNNKWELSISRVRADVIFTPNENSDDPNIEVQESEKICEIFLKLVDETLIQRFEIARITKITNFFKKVDSPIEELKKDYFKATNDGITELIIRFNQPIEEAGLACNNLTQFEAGNRINSNGETSSAGIFITKDFNTNPNKKNIFGKVEVEKFTKLASRYSEV